MDQWHYLYAKGDDYFSAYGIDGFSMMKRTFLDGNGRALGDDRYYYVEAINDELFLANTGTKTLFIGGDGMPLPHYPEFNLALTAKVIGDNITLMPMDDPSGRIRYVLSGDVQSLDYQSTKETLIDGVTYMLNVKSPYIGSSVFYPVLAMKDLVVQDKLNQAIQRFTTEAMWLTDLTGEKIEHDTLERIEQTVVSEITLSLQKNLMNVNVLGYFFGFGAAHPNSFQSTQYLDFSTGDRLSLETLFKEGTDWRGAIVKNINRQFMADEEAFLFIEKTQTEAERLDAFYNAHFDVSFGEAFITVYFPAYEIPPYAAGIPSYEVSYIVLEDYYDPLSAFYKALFY